MNSNTAVYFKNYFELIQYKLMNLWDKIVN